MSDKEARRRFLNREAERLGRFINHLDPKTLVSWSRRYECECGFTCRAPAEIWEHTKGCKA